MTNEKQRILNLLQNKQITKEDYTTLITVLEKKSSKLYMLVSFLLNPFEKLVGFNALLIGLGVIFLNSYLCYRLMFYCAGLLAIVPKSLIHNPKTSYSFALVLYQNLVIWLVVTVIFLLFSCFFKKKKLRIIDFFSSVAICRLPIVVLLLVLYLMQFVQHHLLSSEFMNGNLFRPSIWNSIFQSSNAACVCWLLGMYFFALKISSGLKGKRLVISALGTLIIAAPLSGLFAMWLV